jgi:purine-cytosine permease-like protein
MVFKLSDVGFPYSIIGYELLEILERNSTLPLFFVFIVTIDS